MVGTYVVTSEVVDVALAEHGVVLKLRLAERRGVAWLIHQFLTFVFFLRSAMVRTGDDHELGLSGTESLEGAFVAEHVFARLHNKRQARVDGRIGLLGLLNSRGCRFLSELRFVVRN